jgi:hypothetical protein
VLPPWLQAYIDIIAEYNSLYGPNNWAFLYQTDVRFRSEHLPYMSIRESERLDAALLKNSITDFVPSKPWDYLWRIAVDTADSQESRWWYKEFERKIPMLMTHGMGRFIGGDARVASAPDGHFASTHNAVNVTDKDRSDTSYGGGGGGGKKKSGGSGGGGVKNGGGGGGGGGASSSTPPATKSNQPLTKTRRGKPLCQGYQTGACTGSAGGKCPADDKLLHLCYFCLTGHLGKDCGQTPKSKSSRGGNKPGGKGKGGKN